MKKIAILKHNYCLFFDNSIFLKDNSSLSIEMQAFRFYKNALKSIEELKKIEEISFIALWRKKTKVCYLYKTTNWPEQINEIRYN